MADAPHGGYRVVTTTQTAVVLLEVGVGLSTRTLAQDFGAQFTKSTGSDLKTLGGLQKLQALNPKTTIPVCETRGDGPIFKGAEHLEVWQSCPEQQQALWLIAGRTVEIPLVRVEIETFAEQWVRLQRADACEDVACLKANLPKARASLLEAAKFVSQTSSSAALVPAALPVAASIVGHAVPPVASVSVLVPVDQPRKVDAAPPLGAWSYFLIMLIVVFLASFSFLAARIYRSAQERVAELEKKLRTLNDQLIVARTALQEAEEKALEFRGTILSYFMRLANKLGATLTTSMDHAAMYVALATAHERREQLHREAVERQAAYETEQRTAREDAQREIADQRAEAKRLVDEAAERLRQVEAREASLQRSLELAQRTEEAEVRAERLAAIGVGRETELERTRNELDRAQVRLRDAVAMHDAYRAEMASTFDKRAEENAGMDQKLATAKRERDAFVAALFTDGADGQRAALSSPSTSGSYETVHPDDASQVRPHPAHAERTSIDPASADDFLNWASGFVEDHQRRAFCLTSLAALRQACGLASLPIVFDRALLDASLGASGVHTKPEMQRLLAHATLAALPYLAARMQLLTPQLAQASA